jgi:DNA-binding response OmpR family regulator
MDEPRQQKFLIVETDVKYAAWLQHAIGVGWPTDSIVIMDWHSFARVRTAMTSRDYDIVMLALKFDEGYEEPTTDGLEWLRKLRAQAGFPEMIVLAEGGSELTAVRSLRLGAADYLPKRLLTPGRLTRSLKLTLRGIEKRTGRVTNNGAPADADRGIAPLPHSSTMTRADAGLARAAQAALKDYPAPPALREPPPADPVKSHRSTHTGAGSGLAKAADAALALQAGAKPHISTHTGASLAVAAKAALERHSAEAASKAQVPPAQPAETPKSHVSTQTGSTIVRAAQIATAAPAPAPAKPHIATHTGASLAVAAEAALKKQAVDSAQQPASTQATTSARKVDLNASDPVEHSTPPTRLLTDVQAEAPKPVITARDAKQVAPEIHQIPGYTILQKIGESEAAAVYLAISEDVGHNVALKVSKRKHQGGDPNDTGQRAIMFQREFEAIAALDHPSIIDLFDYGIHDGVEYLAMEYFPCGDLKARLQNPLTSDEAIAFLKEIARSLKVVHDSGIIHRDLKPPNVMLRDDGSVVLIDFGLARSLLAGDGSTRTGVLRGSPYYMSPEQAQGEQLDARTDLYSLGVILYEMLAGRKPYLGASAIDVLQQHVMAPVPELPVHHLFYQPLLERLMSKSRENRIASCDELLAALEQMSQSLGERGTSDPRALVAAGAES